MTETEKILQLIKQWLRNETNQDRFAILAELDQTIKLLILGKYEQIK